MYNLGSIASGFIWVEYNSNVRSTICSSLNTPLVTAFFFLNRVESGGSRAKQIPRTWQLTEKDDEDVRS